MVCPQSQATWAEAAERARPYLKEVAFGRRDEALRAAAEEFGLSAQTLRRAIATLTFVEKIEKTTTLGSASIRSLSLAGLEHIRRWHAYSPERAMDALQELARGATVDAIGAAEYSDRRKRGPSMLGKALSVAYKRVLAAYLTERFKGNILTDVRRSKDSIDTPKVDCRICSLEDGSVSLVAVAMGPYEDAAAYNRMIGDWLVRILGLTLFFENVVMAVPDEEIQDKCLRWLDKNQTSFVENSRERIEIVVLDPYF